MCDLRAGDTSLHDLRRDPVTLLDKPYHSLVVYLPRAVLDVIADEANAPRIRDLSYKPGVGVNDITMSSLGSLLLPPSDIPTRPTRCLSTTFCWRLWRMSLRLMEACGQCHSRSGVGLRHGRNGARRS